MVLRKKQMIGEPDIKSSKGQQDEPTNKHCLVLVFQPPFHKACSQNQGNCNRDPQKQTGITVGIFADRGQLNSHLRNMHIKIPPGQMHTENDKGENKSHFINRDGKPFSLGRFPFVFHLLFFSHGLTQNIFGCLLLQPTPD